MHDETATEEPKPEREPLTARQLISTSLIRLRTRVPLLATLALFARIEPGENVPTVATDGRDILCNPDWLRGTRPAEVDGTLLHTVLHAALLHVPRGEGRDPLRWNAAADVVVNGMVEAAAAELVSQTFTDPFTLPEGAAVRNTTLQTGTAEEAYAAFEANGTRIAPPYRLRDLRDTGRHDPEYLAAYWSRAWVAAREQQRRNGHPDRVQPRGSEVEQAAEQMRAATPLPPISLPDFAAILEGRGESTPFADAPDARFATVRALAAAEAASLANAFRWLVDKAPMEWLQFYLSEAFMTLRARGQMGEAAALVRHEPRLLRFFADYTKLLAA